MKVFLHYLPMVLVAVVWLGIAVWLFIRALRRADDPSKLVVKWILTLLVMGGLLGMCLKVGLDNQAGAFLAPICCAVGGVLATLIWGEDIGGIIARPLTSALTGGQEPPTPEPLYSMAKSKRNRGDFQGALYDIQEQLEKFPNDFTGQMMMAEIQARDLHDSASAALTIERLLSQEARIPAEAATALLQLAEWQSELVRDREAARRTLQRVVDTLPDSSSALTAAQRLAHLDARPERSAEEGTKSIPLRPGARKIGLRKDQGGTLAKVEDVEGIVADLIRQLEAHPLDLEAREQLAMRYAEYYGRVDLACEQLEQLIGLPHQTPAAIVHWLHLMADLHVQQGHNAAAAAEAIRRVVELFPDHPVAAQAQQRLALLELELRRDKTTQAVKLGTYEKNIGLKKPSGRPPPA